MFAVPTIMEFHPTAVAAAYCTIWVLGPLLRFMEEQLENKKNLALAENHGVAPPTPSLIKRDLSDWGKEWDLPICPN